MALSRRREQDTTTAIGIVLSAGFALGVVLLSAQEGFSKDLTAYTVGQILTVGDGDLVAVALAGVLVLVLLGVAGRQLTFRAFDPGGYAAAGYRPVAVDAALLLTVEAVIVVAVPAVGAILAVAILVAPAAVARRHGVRAATDITGFGLAGHTANVARESHLTIELRLAELPLLPGARELSARHQPGAGA